jgi:hypothetical protein
MAFFFCSRKSVAGILNYLTLGIKDLDALALDKDREAEQRNVEAVTARFESEAAASEASHARNVADKLRALME